LTSKMEEINTKDIKKELHVKDSLLDKMKARMEKRKTEKPKKKNKQRTNYKLLMEHHLARAGLFKPLQYYREKAKWAILGFGSFAFLAFIIYLLIKDQLSFGYFVYLLFFDHRLSFL